jgi:hypothetical protein
LTSAVSAKLFHHRYPGIVRMLEGLWYPLMNFQVAFVDKHKRPEACAGRPATVIAMAIESPYEIAIDPVSDRSAQATTGKFWHYICPLRRTLLAKVYAFSKGESIGADCRLWVMSGHSPSGLERRLSGVERTEPAKSGHWALVARIAWRAVPAPERPVLGVKPT